jgi:predicted nucleotidyltransferase
MHTATHGRTTAPSGPARELLSHALGTRAKVACLRVLSLTTGHLTQRDVARRAGVQHRSSQLALDDLARLGLIRRIQGGRDFLVSLSTDHVLSAAVRALFRAESEFFLALRQDLVRALMDGPRRRRPASVVLFGSVARGDDAPGSDLDLLVLTPETDDVEPALTRLDSARGHMLQRYGYALRPIAYTVADARRRWRRREPPLPHIVQDHIVLGGPPLQELLDGAN